MVATGTGFSMASVSARRQLIKVAAICVLMTGMMTVGRGIAFAATQSDKPAAEAVRCVLLKRNHKAMIQAKHQVEPTERTLMNQEQSKPSRISPALDQLRRPARREQAEDEIPVPESSQEPGAESAGCRGLK